MLATSSIGVNPGGVGGVTTPRYWVEGRRGIVKHYYILSCTRRMFESGDFSSEIE